jgi:hypothetical protein
MECFQIQAQSNLKSVGLAVLAVLDVVVGGGGSSALPPVGMLPAKIGVDSAHMSASATANRFMDVAPFEVLRKMPAFYIKGSTAKSHMQQSYARIHD